MEKFQRSFILSLFLPFLTLLPFLVLSLIHSVFRENVCWLAQPTAFAQEMLNEYVLNSFPGGLMGLWLHRRSIRSLKARLTQ